MNSTPCRQIRAVYTENTIRVYQAYSHKIADSALESGTFISPPFKMERMTWIKPSFLWMMYRSGWGTKPGQERILAIDITREGFEWALMHSCLSHYEVGVYSSKEEWQNKKVKAPVRIQWDPERDIKLNQLKYRSIQIGLSKEAVTLYTNEWIRNITDITTTVAEIRSLVERDRLDAAKQRLPLEIPYTVSNKLAEILGMGIYSDTAISNTISK